MSLSKPCNFSFYPDSLDYYSIYTTIFIPCYHHFCHIIMVCLPPFIASCYPDSLDCSLYHPLYIYTYIYITCMYIYIYPSHSTTISCCQFSTKNRGSFPASKASKASKAPGSARDPRRPNPRAPQPGAPVAAMG
jgi:hypothetical protein